MHTQAALPGGYEMGDMLYYTGATFPDDDDELVRGRQYEVMGPGDPPDEKTHLAMKFPGVTSDIDVQVAEPSRKKPVLVPAPPVLHPRVDEYRNDNICISQFKCIMFSII